MRNMSTASLERIQIRALPEPARRKGEELFTADCRRLCADRRSEDRPDSEEDRDRQKVFHDKRVTEGVVWPQKRGTG